MNPRQLSLFDAPRPTPPPSVPPAPHSGPATSRAAAAAIAPRLARLEAAVRDALARAGAAGATAEELEAATGLGGSTVRPRLIKLRELGHARDSGRTRPTRSGRSAVVWIIHAPPPDPAPED